MKNVFVRLGFIGGVLFSPMGISDSIASNKVGEMQAIDKSPIIVEFIAHMAKTHGFQQVALENLFSDAKHLPSVVERMTRPAEAWPWHRYRKLLVKPERIEQGIEFWRENEETLHKAEKEFGVPAEIIVAILGVETRYGRIKGHFRLLDSLSTLVVDYPRRSKFFKKELEQMLLLARDEDFDPSELMGSYAGAMGYPQFISSSYRHYAIDFSGDGVRDLFNSRADAIGSIASYLSKHGWQAGEPITAPAAVDGGKFKKLIKKGLKPKLSYAELVNYGVSSPMTVKSNTKTALIELEQTDAKEYWVVLKNFYAITRYNHSQLYAMAVYQLAQNIKQQKNASS